MMGSSGFFFFGRIWAPGQNVFSVCNIQTFTPTTRFRKSRFCLQYNEDELAYVHVHVFVFKGKSRMKICIIATCEDSITFGRLPYIWYSVDHPKALTILKLSITVVIFHFKSAFMISLQAS